MDNLISFIETHPAEISFGVIVFGLIIMLMCWALVKNTAFSWIREIVYNAIVDAEKEFQYGENNEKFDYVVDIVRNALPKPISVLITTKTIKRIVQVWFDTVKNILDYKGE